MNVARSTFVRRGYLLAALAVALLLAGFSGTAWAQTTTVGSPLGVSLTMRASSSTLGEGASMDAATPGRVTVTITWSGAYDADTTLPGAATDVFDNADTNHVKLTATCNGQDFSGTPAASPCSFEVTAKEGVASGASFATLGDAGADLKFDVTPDTADDAGKVVKTIELYISDTSDDGDWDEETIGLTLELVDKTVTVVTGRDDSNNDGVIDATDTVSTNQTRKLTATPRQLTLTIADDERKPTLKFVPPSIQLAKGNIQDVTALVGLDTGGRIDLPTTNTGIRTTLAGLTAAGDDILLSVSPPDAVGTLIEFVDENDMTRTLPAATEGRYNIGTIGATSADAANGAVGETYDMATEGIKLRIKAIDVSGFRDEQITLTLEEGRTEASMMAEGGSIDPSEPATVTVLSGEATPTVTFSTDSISIDEGDSERVHLLADTDQGDQVGSATVSVSGDARIALEQNGSAISGGNVSFDGSANAELMIRALGDESLEDGEEKTATVTITDASGANIGEQRTLTVTVVGSTAVPVLPLVGQLLLALLLTAGGARFYRRRQQ